MLLRSVAWPVTVPEPCYWRVRGNPEPCRKDDIAVLIQLIAQAISRAAATRAEVAAAAAEDMKAAIFTPNQ